MEVALVTAIIITSLAYLILTLKKSVKGESGCHPGSDQCSGCSCSLKEKYDQEKLNKIAKIDAKEEKPES